jgi:hypothetical protein
VIYFLAFLAKYFPKYTKSLTKNHFKNYFKTKAKPLQLGADGLLGISIVCLAIFQIESFEIVHLCDIFRNSFFFLPEFILVNKFITKKVKSFNADLYTGV